MNFNFVLVFALFCGVSCQLTPAQNNDPALIAISQDLVAKIKTFIDNFQYLASSGVLNLKVPVDTALLNTSLITLPGSIVLNAGLVALPVGFVCNAGVKAIETLACYLVNADCTYVHNTYGGRCAAVANPVNGTAQTGTQIAFCNDQNPAGSTDFVDDSVARCGGVFNVPAIDNAIYKAIAAVTRIRMRALLCQYVGPLLVSGVGCANDCRNNHQYENGTCNARATHVSTLIGESPVGVNCICSGPHE